MSVRQNQLKGKYENDLFARLELQQQFSFNLKQAVFNRTIAGDPEPSCLTWLWLYWVISEAAIALWLGKEEYLNWGLMKSITQYRRTMRMSASLRLTQMQLAFT